MCIICGLALYLVFAIISGYFSIINETERTLKANSRAISDSLIPVLLAEQKAQLKSIAADLGGERTIPELAAILKSISFHERRLNGFEALALIDAKGNIIETHGKIVESDISIEGRALVAQASPDRLIDAVLYDGQNSSLLQGARVNRLGSDLYLFATMSDSDSSPLQRIINTLRVGNAGFAALFIQTESTSDPVFAPEQMSTDIKINAMIKQLVPNRLSVITNGSKDYRVYKSPVSDTDLFLVQFVLASEIWSTLYRHLSVQLLAVLILGMILWYSVGFVIRATTEPFSELVAGVSPLGEGNLDIDFKPPRRSDEIGALAKTYSHLLNIIRDRNTKLNEIAVRDQLTGMLNRKEMEARLQIEWSRALRYGNTLGFIVLDIDALKAINNDFGYDAGDLTIRKIAGIILNNLRSSDTSFRNMGGKFCIILPEANLDQSNIVAEKLRIKTQELEPITMHGSQRPVTVSIGVSAYPNAALDAADLVTMAEAALQRAKEFGGDRVVSAKLIHGAGTPVSVKIPEE